MKIFACLSFAVALSACGGNVVVDADSTTTGTTGPVDHTCVELCEQVPAECSSGQACATQCETTDKLGNELCHDTYQAFLACALADPTMLCGDAVCPAEAEAFSLCLANACASNPADCQF